MILSLSRTFFLSGDTDADRKTVCKSLSPHKIEHRPQIFGKSLDSFRKAFEKPSKSVRKIIPETVRLLSELLLRLHVLKKWSGRIETVPTAET